MSEENVEIVRKAFDSKGARSFEETAEIYWHPDIVYVEDPRWPGAATYTGRDAVLACFQAYMEALGSEDDMEVSVERVFDVQSALVNRVALQLEPITPDVEPTP